MRNNTKLQLRIIIVVCLSICLPFFSNAQVKSKVLKKYKLNALVCNKKITSLFGEYEANALFNIKSNGDFNLNIQRLTAHSPLLSKDLQQSIIDLKNKSSQISLANEKPRENLILPQVGCETKVIAIRTTDKNLILDSNLWPTMSSELKDRAYLDLAWSEKTGRWTPLVSSFFMSDWVTQTPSGDRLRQLRSFFVPVQELSYLSFKNIRSEDRSKQVYDDFDVRALNQDFAPPTWMKTDQQGKVVTFGDLTILQPPKKIHLQKYPIKNDRRLSALADPYHAKIMFPNFKFPIANNSLQSTFLVCPTMHGNINNDCNDLGSRSWEVTFNSIDNSIQEFKCISYAIGEKATKGGWMGGMGQFWDIFITHLRSCDIELFGQKIRIQDPNVFTKFNKDLHSIFTVSAKFFPDNTIEITLPNPEKPLNHSSAQRFYRNPKDNLLYGGTLILDSKGNIINNTAIVVE